MFYKNFLFELEKEQSKPLRRFDSELDYIPSQHICEFIKSNGYGGVEYGSSLNKNGVNLAIFDDSKLQCIDTKVVEIKSIELPSLRSQAHCQIALNQATSKLCQMAFQPMPHRVKWYGKYMQQRLPYE